jgi:hypothetical protein
MKRYQERAMASRRKGDCRKDSRERDSLEADHGYSKDVCFINLRLNAVIVHLLNQLAPPEHDHIHRHTSELILGAPSPQPPTVPKRAALRDSFLARTACDIVAESSWRLNGQLNRFPPETDDVSRHVPKNALQRDPNGHQATKEDSKLISKVRHESMTCERFSQPKLRGITPPFAKEIPV